MSIFSFVRVTCKGVGKTTATSAGYTTCILATQLQAMGIACSHIVANSPILGVRCRAERNEIWYTWSNDGRGDALLGRKRGLRMRAGSMPCMRLRSMMSRSTCDVTGTRLPVSPPTSGWRAVSSRRLLRSLASIKTRPVVCSTRPPSTQSTAFRRVSVD